ncbi:MAG: hypothetical protein HN786_01030, partial [Cellvibrionales bacterium]|nr:hypothetical protein [Cellvibrionales bacterium]
KIFKNFTNLEEELVDSDYKEDFSILREAWNLEISKPGCTQCLKNGAMNKYSQIATSMLSHSLSIEESKQVLDLRTDLSKKHQEVAKEINSEVNAKIEALKAAKNS